MYRIILCDDDPAQAEHWKRLVAQALGETACFACCQSVNELERLMENFPSPHIALMDIDLGQGENGIDAVKRLFPERSGVQVIYVTGHIEYCTRVYETEHVSFLLKPVDPEQLRAALDRAKDKADKRARSGLHVQVRTKDHFLFFSDLRFVESTGRKLRFVCGGQIYESYARLKDVTQKLDGRFYQCHKSFAVNLDFVSSCDGRDFVLTTGERIPISGSRRTEARKQFLHHLSDTLPL